MAKKAKCRLCDALFDKVGRQEFCAARCRRLYWFHAQRQGPDRRFWHIRGYARAGIPVTLSVEDAAYIAGLMDGEGHIGLAWARTQNPYAYQPRMNIVNTNRSVMDWMAKALGGNGSVAIRQPKGNAKRIYTYSWSRGQIGIVLPQLMPYLKIKRPMADAMMVALKLFDVPFSQRPMDEVHGLWLTLRALNRKGKG